MKVVESDELTFIEVFTNKRIKKENKLIEAVTDEEIFLYLEKQRKNLTECLYYLPEAFLLRNNQVYACIYKYIEEKSNVFNLSIEEKRLVIDAIFKAIMELKSIGLLYWDIDVENILLNENDIMLKRLGRCIKNDKGVYLYHQLRNFVDYILSLYLGYKTSLAIISPQILKDILSKESYEYISYVLSKEVNQVDESIYYLVDDLEDEDKQLVLKNTLSKKII